MAYKKGNRHVTDEQFSDGTTIDGSRIDKAIDDIIDHQNEIPKGDMEARWMPTTYVMCWSPQRPFWRHREIAQAGGGVIPALNVNRSTPDACYATQDHWFPWLAAHNHADEVFPVSAQPTQGFVNEYRDKGFFHNPAEDQVWEDYSRAFDRAPGPGSSHYTNTPDDVDETNTGLIYRYIPLDDAPVINMSNVSSMNKKHFTCAFPFYFNKPVIVTGISVFAAQEHPVSFFNSGEDSGAGTFYNLDVSGAASRITDGYKINAALQANQYDYTTDRCDLAAGGGNTSTIEAVPGVNGDPFDVTASPNGSTLAKSGNEFPGEKWTNVNGVAQGGMNFGQGTISLDIDNEFNSEDRRYTTVAFHKFNMGNQYERFNQYHPTNSTTGHAVPYSGGDYVDMTPAYGGGSTWGVWSRENNLNIPIPRDSRVRLAITTSGFRNTQLFEWHIALTVLEMVEE